MASKLLKETKDTEINNKKQKARVEKDDIYKIDLELGQDNQNTEQFTQHDEKEKPKKASKNMLTLFIKCSNINKVTT